MCILVYVHVGTYNIQISQLREPPEYLQVREVKEWYIEYLEEMLLDDTGDHEDLTSPLLVLASVSKEEFREKCMDKYSYQVIGGVQRFSAIVKINRKEGGRKITCRKCAVYDSALSRKESLILARQHNEVNQIQRSTTFPEVAAACRRLMFVHFAEQEDDGKYMPEVPRYNSQKYRDWKQECLDFLVSTQLVCFVFFPLYLTVFH